MTPLPLPSAPVLRLSRRAWLCSVAAVGAMALANPLRAATALPGDPAGFAPLLDEVSDLVLPGSRVAAPGAYIASVLPNRWRGLTAAHVQQVSDWLDARAGGPFLARPLSERFAALAALDDAAFAAPSPSPLAPGLATAWQTTKRALLTAWYTSQAGGAGDLAFDLVPGRWEADVPLSTHPHPLSNDWLAIWFS